MSFARGMITVALAAMLAGCGGTESSFSSESHPAPSAVSPAESEACRSDLGSAVSLAGQADGATPDNVDALNTLSDKVAAVAKQVDQDCSSTVSDTMATAKYHAARAAASAQACSFMSMCSDRPITKDLVALSKYLRDAAAESERTE